MKSPTRHHYRSLLAATLLMGGSMSYMPTAFAEGTTGGTAISNTATATYVDANNPNTPINSTSNTVVVQVAEVAGITVTASGTSLRTDAGTIGQANAGDVVNFIYTVTNVGNDPTKFRIPNLATVTGPGSVTPVTGPGGTTGTLEYSTDGGNTWTFIPATELITDSIAPGGSVMVRVPVLVAAGAQVNDVINVTLGNTPGDAQNQFRTPDGGDVYTVDNVDGTVPTEVAGAPVNGTREASVTQRTTIGATLKTYALATILKTRTAYNNQGTPQIAGDTLTYGLSLRVESNDPTGNGIAPAALTGRTITLDNLTPSRILVSDAIPTGTELSVAPTPPPGWTVVYTTTPVTTDADTAIWTTVAPALNTVTRVGFVNNPTTVTSVSPGTTVSGFNIELRVSVSAPVLTSLTIANIAQVFGQTSGTNTPVYDESGDQRPSNYNDNGTPMAGTDTVGNDGIPDTLTPALIDDGFIGTPSNPETGTDVGNNNTAVNTGTDITGGEANVFIVSEPVASSLQNGPDSVPDAVGPTSNSDDFTNKSSLVPPNTAPGSTLDPAAVGFTNTVRNNGTSPGTLTLQPIAPGGTTPNGVTVAGVAGDLPNNTTVTITSGSDSVTYTYNAGTFTLNSSTINVGGVPQPISIPNFAVGQTANYGVEVNLPPGTALSTDINRGFPVPILASIDTVAGGAPEASNVTIDRVYTGFLRMLKESRVLTGTGPAVLGTDGNFSTTQKRPAPGNILEYRITYNNISEAQSGTGNIILNAANVVISEDGTTGGNNWALDNDANGQIDTSNVISSAADSGAATITFFSGNPATTSAGDQTGTTVTTDVTKYVDAVTGTVAPGQSRTFGFQRKVN